MHTSQTDLGEESPQDGQVMGQEFNIYTLTDDNSVQDRRNLLFEAVSKGQALDWGPQIGLSGEPILQVRSLKGHQNAN